MKIKNITPAPKSSFLRVARKAVKLAKEQSCIVRFIFGGTKYQTAPKSSLMTLEWQHAKASI